MILYLDKSILFFSLLLATAKNIKAASNSSRFPLGIYKSLISLTYSRSIGTYSRARVSATRNKGFYCQFYGDSDQSGNPACQHTDTTLQGKTDATCTEAGYTGDTVCADCGAIVAPGTVLPTIAHDYKDGACTVCGTKDPATVKYTVHFIVPNGADAIASIVGDVEGITLPTASAISGYTFLGWTRAAVNHVTEAPVYLEAGSTFVSDADVVLYALYSYTVEGPATGVDSGSAEISFADKTNRTEQDGSHQVWVQNGITVTNNKGASTNNVADYADPARFYANSELIISCAGMTKIEFTCGSGTYATALKNSLNAISGITVAVSGSNVTVTFASAQDVLIIPKLTAQVRLSSIKIDFSIENKPSIYYTTVIGEGACDHADAKVIEGKAPTCTEKGYNAHVTCEKCDYTTYEEIAATGHSHKAVVTPPTCTEKGYTTHTCSCGDTYVTDEIAALGHKDENGNGACDACGTTLTPATEATEATTAPSTDATTAPATDASTNAGTSEKKGCAGTFGATSVGVILLIGTGAVMFFKKKED